MATLINKTTSLEKRESEKQILVDPISLRDSPAGSKKEAMLQPHHHKYNLLPKSSSKFMSWSSSSSLPKSASSSPRAHRDSLTSAKHKKNKSSSKKDHQPSPLARQHSVALSNLERLRESHMRRSKSCGEGRACQPSVDFDMWSTTTTATTNIATNNIDWRREINNGGGHEVIVRAIANKEDEGGKTVMFHRKGGDDKFKCGACLFLPSFGKAVKARKDNQDEEAHEPEPEPERGMADMMMTTMDIVSKRASLEKFECGSWRSSAVINYGEEEEDEDNEDGSAGSNLFFDLPVELIRCTSINDTESPVTTAFVFDNKQQDHHRKGVLKNTTTMVASIGQPGRKSQESCNSSCARHVRFSTSSPASPTCITPRLHKARDDFNAFLEAQSA